MKKALILLIIIVFSSCSTSGRVCGGSGGKRVVDTSKNLYKNC